VIYIEAVKKLIVMKTIEKFLIKINLLFQNRMIVFVESEILYFCKDLCESLSLQGSFKTTHATFLKCGTPMMLILKNYKNFKLYIN